MGGGVSFLADTVLGSSAPPEETYIFRSLPPEKGSKPASLSSKTEVESISSVSRKGSLAIQAPSNSKLMVKANSKLLSTPSSKFSRLPSVNGGSLTGVRESVVLSSKHNWLLKRALIQPKSMEAIELGRIIGAGLMGIVRVAKLRDNGGYFAIKIISKSYIDRHRDHRHVMNEKEALREANSPFCPKLFGSFQDAGNVYLAMEFGAGGELFRRLSKKKSLGPNTAKFYACEIFSALHHLQDLGYVYRDLKPENVILDEEGHCKLVDFGFITKPDEDGKMRTMCGTPAYLSPEQLDGKFTNGYTRIVDWWSFGVFLYELLTGTPPFCKSNTETVYAVYTRILHSSIAFPRYVDADSKDLISNLCRPNVEQRLVDPMQIRGHAYFQGVDWSDVAKRRLVPPFVPALYEAGDTHFFMDYPEPPDGPLTATEIPSQPLTEF